MLRAYKYRLYPNKSQIDFFEKQFGTCRFVYNWALDLKSTVYKDENRSISKNELKKMLPGLKVQYNWLKDVNSQSLQGSIDNLDNAFQKFFRKEANYPNFKSKYNPVQSFQVPQHYVVDLDNGTVKLPKLKEPIKAKFHRRFDGETRTATVSRTPTGKYFISILVDDGQELPEKIETGTTIGVDVGISHFAILSTGEKIENPRHLKTSLKKLQHEQRALSRKKKGSSNRKKQKLVVAKLHEKIANQRNDFHHKVSKRLIDKNQAICLEDLNISGMVKNHCLAQAISDVAWSSFIEKLRYKADWYGKTIMQIGRFVPSSKLCSICGYKNADLTLNDRSWECPSCHTKHDRDVNAAINILNIALNNIAAGTAV
ncbi:MAG: IS200/IS605 family element RNA-guided endonuclease TnpB [Methanolobus sp.]|uniref:IS200/IS605 family element RNA-guided endonuclease TnpB n=2 Tax=Methanolobus sp. TaxID=1874737 RepID=UPI00272F7A21|nr:IS200/IS605 family element RNA-guided endonuclease TnpB [Methanolobus sp.]MDP2216704.1 IS200/IS605 family element RNA-guided endonuclease TnpB [Methanolobus sp.]